MFREEVENKNKSKKTLNNKVSEEKEIPEILDNTVETPKYSPEKGERVIYNPYGKFTSPDDKLCRVIEKKSVKDNNYYRLKLIEEKRTKSVGVPKIEWDSRIIYEDVPEKNIMSVLELFTY